MTAPFLSSPPPKKIVEIVESMLGITSFGQFLLFVLDIIA